MTRRFAPQATDIATALALLTRIPVRTEFTRTAAASWAFPLAGLAVGLIAGAMATIAGWLNLGIGLTAGLTIAATILTTGAMHEDGLADSADGFWGGIDRARRLEIMRDSRIGTYGVLALGLALILRFAALSDLIRTDHIVPALIAAAMLSRVPMPYLMAFLPPARSDGLSVRTGKPPRDAASLSAITALAFSWLLIGFVPTVIAATAVLTATLLAAKLALKKIGGQTGDVLGATQVLSELAALAALVALT